MKTKLLLSLAVFSAAVCANAQEQMHDWAQFGRYAKANEQVTASPKAVFMGDSITDGWDDNDQGFFTDNGFVCRGISGQTTSEMLVRTDISSWTMHSETSYRCASSPGRTR